jgi:hypothetical protein
VGARTDAARADVVAARKDLADEVDRLEAAGRAAVDIPARLRREPAKVVGAAAGAAFLVAGGPGRLLRRLTGRKGNVDKASIIPEAIQRGLGKRGADGEKTKKQLEKDFAKYLESRGSKDKGAALAIGGTAAQLISNVLKPVTQRAGRRLAEELFDADRETARESLRKVRARQPDGKPPQG